MGDDKVDTLSTVIMNSRKASYLSVTSGAPLALPSTVTPLYTCYQIYKCCYLPILFPSQLTMNSEFSKFHIPLLPHPIMIENSYDYKPIDHQGHHATYIHHHNHSPRIIKANSLPLYHTHILSPQHSTHHTHLSNPHQHSQSLPHTLLFCPSPSVATSPTSHQSPSLPPLTDFAPALLFPTSNSSSS